jgi:hypothetical protein
MMANKKRYWHYTTLEHTASIQRSGFIRVAKIGVSHGVKPVTWFSTNPAWEPTVFKPLVNKETGEEIFLYAREDFLKYGILPIRIEVDQERAKLRGWNNYKKNSGDSKSMIKGLEKVAKELGANPKDWFVSYDDVSLDCCLSMEAWTGAAWVDLRKVDPEEQKRLQQMKV